MYNFIHLNNSSFEKFGIYDEKSIRNEISSYYSVVLIDKTQSKTVNSKTLKSKLKW